MRAHVRGWSAFIESHGMPTEVRRVALVGLATLLLALVAAPARGQDRPLSPGAERLAELGPHFALVKIHVKRSDKETPSAGPFGGWPWQEDPIAAKYAPYLDAKMPIKAAGVVLRPDTVLMPDIVLDDDYLDRIEVVDWYGNASPATRAAVLVHAPALVIHIEDPAALKVSPVEFGELAEGGIAEGGLSMVTARQSGAAWSLVGMPMPGAEARLDAGGGPEAFLVAGLGGPGAMWTRNAMIFASSFLMSGQDTLRSPSLILDRERRVIGAAFTQRMPVSKGAAPLWMGPDLLADDRVPFESLSDRQSGMKDRVGKCLYEIEIRYRQKPEESASPWEMDETSFEFSPYSLGQDEEIPTEATFYGLATSPRTLFVPHRIQRDHVMQIDTIRVKTATGELDGRFAGAYRDIAAFRVMIDADLVQRLTDTASAPELPLHVPLLSLRAEKRAGKKTLHASYTRAGATILGYKDVPESVMEDESLPGMFYADLDGALQAILLEQRKDDEATARFREERYSYSMDFEQLVRPYTLAELADHLQQPERYADNTMFVLDEGEKHRRMWLGIEFDALNEDLAKTLSLEGPTKDGKIGLLVSTVYPNSPAARIGLDSGCVLLRIRALSGGEPVELKVPESFNMGFDPDDIEIPEGMEMFGFKMPERKRWKSRDNILTSLLGAIGEGETVELTYVTGDGQTQKAQLAIEKAPPDFESAQKYKSDSVGLTVKALTYEVRSALMVADDLSPVVVSDVEEGTPADVARIKKYDLIANVGDTPVDGIEVFKVAVEAAEATKQQGGSAVLRLSLTRLGKTRIADVSLE